MSSLDAAWTAGMETPARADTAAKRPVVLMNSRRVVRELEDSFIVTIFRTFQTHCQFKKSDEEENFMFKERFSGLERPHLASGPNQSLSDPDKNRAFYQATSCGGILSLRP